jgi:hypothetical protein
MRLSVVPQIKSSAALGIHMRCLMLDGWCGVVSTGVAAAKSRGTSATDVWDSTPEKEETIGMRGPRANAWDVGFPRAHGTVAM